MWLRLISIGLTALGAYLLVKHWNDIVHNIAKWAREKNYNGIIRVLCNIETIRASIVQITFRFLGIKGEDDNKNPPVITTETIDSEELPEEFQYVGTREHEISIE